MSRMWQHVSHKWQHVSYMLPHTTHMLPHTTHMLPRENITSKSGIYVLLSHFTFRLHRYNIMTSNIVESVNAMFEVEREFPIVALFDEINRRFAVKFHERRIEFANSPNRFVPKVEKKYQSTSIWATNYWLIKLLTTVLVSVVMVMLL